MNPVMHGYHRDRNLGYHCARNEPVDGLAPHPAPAQEPKPAPARTPAARRTPHRMNPKTTLRVLTFSHTPEQPACAGGYTCPCASCEHDRRQRVDRGPRKRRDGIPIKRRAAA